MCHQQKTNFRITFLVQACYETRWSPHTDQRWFDLQHFDHLKQQPLPGALIPTEPQNKAGLNLPCSLTTWAKARHKVCSITQVFSKAERAAMVPLPCLLLLASPNPLFSLHFPLLYSSPGRHGAQLVEQSCPRGRRGAGGGGGGREEAVCTAPKKKIHSGGRRVLEGVGWGGGWMKGGIRRGGGEEGRGHRERCDSAPQAAHTHTHTTPVNSLNMDSTGSVCHRDWTVCYSLSYFCKHWSQTTWAAIKLLPKLYGCTSESLNEMIPGCEAISVTTGQHGPLTHSLPSPSLWMCLQRKRSEGSCHIDPRPQT